MYEKEFKFKSFDFRDFMDFVLNLADYYGLGHVRFYPDKKEFFDDFQLEHIAPRRDIDDKRGFVWAWRKKEGEVRVVEFDQFTENEIAKVRIKIDLDNKYIKIMTCDGISPLIIEDLVEKKFIGNTISDIELEKLQMRVGLLEFISALFFSICFTSIFALSKILNIYYNWYTVSYYFAFFFGLALFLVYVLLPIIQIVKKVGLSCKKIFSEISIEFQRATKLNKLMVFLSVLGIILSIIFNII